MKYANPLFILIFLFYVSSLFARDVEILVLDADLGLPLGGAVIHSWDVREYLCNEDGRAVFSVPDDRQVVIQAAYPGYENGRLVVTAGTDNYTISLRLSGIMEGGELVVEAQGPESGESKTGRSITVSERDIALSGEIGPVEDVMNTIKLLPGVGYAGFTDAQPSIRGGDPEDLKASLDGFYIFYPYRWGGVFSIFDPRMVQSARLSHGVFSSRFGHTISGLLDVTSKNPSLAETEFGLGLSSGSANFNLSFPLFGKGGILFMGNITFLDPIFVLYKEMAKSIEAMEIVNAVRIAPYIRSGAITGNYRFFDNLELRATGFFGMDGMGINSENSSGENGFESVSIDRTDLTNYQAFIISGLSWNPSNDMLLKLTAGAGYQKTVTDYYSDISIYDKSFIKTPANAWYYDTLSGSFKSPYNFETKLGVKQSVITSNVQGRIDYDWELAKGLLLAAGVQEMFSSYSNTGNQQFNVEKKFSEFDTITQNRLLVDEMKITDLSLRDFLLENLYISIPAKYSVDAQNKLFISSGYGLVEYNTSNNRLSAELGLRIDHYYLSGDDLDLPSKPALNPRINMDFNVIRNMGFVQSFSLSAGTGLFSSMNNNVFNTMGKYNIDTLKPNRSWTSILGASLELPGGFSFNIEGYFKYLFDRMYIPVYAGLEDVEIKPQFNGEGRVWGIDLMLQKKQSRFWDGWVSYSFNWAKYRDPNSGNADMGFSGGVSGSDWYFPDYHRFHNLNLVINIKPTPRFNIYTRLGLASGVQLLNLTGKSPESYPVYIYDPDNSANNQFIEKFFWLSKRDDKKRVPPSLQLDLKFSIFGKDKMGKKTISEVYVAVENILGLLYSAQGNPAYNSYTGEVETGILAASYDLPIPIPSVGVKMSY